MNPNHELEVGETAAEKLRRETATSPLANSIGYAVASLLGIAMGIGIVYAGVVCVWPSIRLPFSENVDMVAGAVSILMGVVIIALALYMPFEEYKGRKKSKT